MYKKGQFVECTFQDEVEGKITYKGLVVDYSVKDVIVQITPNGSTITIPQLDATLKEIAQPAEWSIELPKKEEVNTTSVTKPVVKRERSKDGESKADKALVIYKGMMFGSEHPARGEVIVAFMEQLGMTKAGASTYQYNCKKAITG